MNGCNTDKDGTDREVNCGEEGRGNGEKHEFYFRHANFENLIRQPSRDVE